MKKESRARIEKDRGRSLLGLLISVGVIVLAGIAGGCGGTPSADEAYAETQKYVRRRLLIENWDLPPECVYEAPEWHRINVNEGDDGEFDVRGAVVAGNFYCVIDVSYFSATVRFDKSERQWNLIGEVEFSNPCVTIERKYFAEECFSSQWSPGWEPGD